MPAQYANLGGRRFVNADFVNDVRKLYPGTTKKIPLGYSTYVGWTGKDEVLFTQHAPVAGIKGGVYEVTTNVVNPAAFDNKILKRIKYRETKVAAVQGLTPMPVVAPTHTARKSERLCGYARLVQACCKISTSKLNLRARDLMKTAVRRDEAVIAFLQHHVKKGRSLSARVLLGAYQESLPKLATEITAASAKLGMYGFPVNTANLGLRLCSNLRELAGVLAANLHTKETLLYPPERTASPRYAAYSVEFLARVNNMHFRSPDTGNQVLFQILPKDEQRKIHERWKGAERPKEQSPTPKVQQNGERPLGQETPPTAPVSPLAKTPHREMDTETPPEDDFEEEYKELEDEDLYHEPGDTEEIASLKQNLQEARATHERKKNQQGDAGDLDANELGDTEDDITQLRKLEDQLRKKQKENIQRMEEKRRKKSNASLAHTFLDTHSKTAKCGASQLILSCYPEPGFRFRRKFATPTSVGEWVTWSPDELNP
jgi:hypothetical protein